ncbi:MAG TPA: NTF2 fold immunity protein [Chitinophagaceae bacterium]|nr:NTF2 fold immunity protein [Chitinophagaceae bacterium]
MQYIKHLPKILCLSVAIFLFFGNNYINGQNKNDYFDKIDYVPNKETAIKIAEAVWLPIYGNKIYNEMPFTARLDTTKGIWIVSGTLYTEAGGVACAYIQKKDGKIIKVYHGK